MNWRGNWKPSNHCQGLWSDGQPPEIRPSTPYMLSVAACMIRPIQAKHLYDKPVSRTNAALHSVGDRLCRINDQSLRS
jgi:hypothetical protein